MTFFKRLKALDDLLLARYSDKKSNVSKICVLISRDISKKQFELWKNNIYTKLDIELSDTFSNNATHVILPLEFTIEIDKVFLEKLFLQ